MPHKSPGVRFTSWLSAEERAALRALATEQGCSENFIIRSALRALLFGLEPTNYQRLREVARQQKVGINEARSIAR